MRVINLKEEDYFIDQYVRLRNKYAELLLTLPVNTDGTKEWLLAGNVLIRGLAEGEVLLGAVILYLAKDNEVAFFAREQGRGIGTRLLGIIEEAARDKGMKSIRAWVLKDNLIAQRAFEKCGFSKAGMSERQYKGLPKSGIEYIKSLA